jgi:ArsR family transcriptional regulator
MSRLVKVVYRSYTIDMKGDVSRTRSEKFAKSATKLAKALKALAHPARLAIVEALASRGECVCGEIVEVVPLAQATVSQHLKVLREAGLIKGEIEGVTSCYCLDSAGLTELETNLGTLFKKLGRGPRSSTGCCSPK